jgi:acetylglutamate kinase
MQNQFEAGKAEALLEALPFIQRFRGQTFVIKYGGSAMEDDHLIERLLRDVVFLEAVGINPVLVHGGGKAISQRMRDAGKVPRFVNGLRVTDEATIKIVEHVLDHVIRPRIVSTMEGFGGRAEGFSGRDVFKAKRLPPQSDGKNLVDVGFVGELVSLDLAGVREAIDREVVPVISPIAQSDDQTTILNVNADLAAGAMAGALKAAKMIYVSDVMGIMRDVRDPNSLIPTVNRENAAHLIKHQIIEGGMIPKVLSAVEALNEGVGKVHLIDGRIHHALLLEIFTTNGIGTEIVP